MVDIKLLDFNEQACYIFGKLFKDLQNKGKPTQIPDLMIGSITKAYSLIFHLILIHKGRYCFHY